MAKSKSVVKVGKIQRRILLVRGEKVIVDADLAEFYGVPTKVLNQAVRRNMVGLWKYARQRKGKEDMIKLHDKNTQELIGEINEKQLQFLIDELVEEDSADQDYYINRDQLDQLEKKGGDETLIQMLRDALGTKDDMDIIWTKS